MIKNYYKYLFISKLCLPLYHSITQKQFNTMETQIAIPTHQEIYDMMFAGISLQAILDMPIKFSSEKEVFDFWTLANRVTTNPCILEKNNY